MILFQVELILITKRINRIADQKDPETGNDERFAAIHQQQQP